MESGLQRRIDGQQCLRLRAEFRPHRVNWRQILFRERMLLDRNDMQPAAVSGVPMERLPGAQKIQSGAEPKLHDGEQAALRKTGSQRVAIQKDMPRFLWAAVQRKVEIAELDGVQATVS